MPHTGYVRIHMFSLQGRQLVASFTSPVSIVGKMNTCKDLDFCVEFR